MNGKETGTARLGTINSLDHPALVSVEALVLVFSPLYSRVLTNLTLLYDI